MNQLLTVCKRSFSANKFNRYYTNMAQKLVIDEGKTPSIIGTVPRPFKVSIEGNIGAGKSTVINYLGLNPGVEIYTEPIEWWRNLNGHNLLDLLYKDIHKWYSVFQNYVQLTRVKIQTTPPKHQSTTVQIFERSIQNSRFCFLEQAHEAHYLEQPEYDVMDAWYQWIEENIDIEIDFVIYLRSSPKTVYERMKSRGRKEEETVPFEYLKALHSSHERWIFSGRIKPENLLIIDADGTLDEVFKQCDLNKNKFIKPKLIENK